MLPSRTGGFQRSANILERLRGLGGDIVRADKGACRVKRDLARDVERSGAAGFDEL
jgi:hypothetical protein